METAQKTLEVTIHRGVRIDNTKLTRNFGTGDRILRYKHISKFFLDNLFATNNSGKPSRGHTCCQLFVTGKAFMYVVPTNSKGEVIQSVKQCDKKIGAPESIICDGEGEKTSNDLLKLC